MEIADNPELSRQILDHLADLYGIKKKREGTHLSTLIYCLTRSFFDQKGPVEPTDQEVMLFSLGYGLQDVLTPKKTETPIYEKDGITFSPDFIFPVEGRLVEIKTTRMSSSKGEFPETWLEYMMGGCYMQGINEYELSVLHILGNYKPPFPQIKSYHLTFDEKELMENWGYLIGRRDTYQDALDNSVPPQPYSFCKEWECKNCRYKLQCEAIQMLAEAEKGD